jgi:hypothetical protein
MHIEDPYCTYTSHMMPYVHAYNFRSQAVSMDSATKLSKLEHNVQSVPRAKESRSDSNCFLRHLSLGQ